MPRKKLESVKRLVSLFLIKNLRIPYIEVFALDRTKFVLALAIAFFIFYDHEYIESIFKFETTKTGKIHPSSVYIIGFRNKLILSGNVN